MQKKILLAIIICTSVTTVVNAQIKKGAKLLGGQLAFFTQYSKDAQTNSAESKNNSFTFSPAFGKAIKENLVIGGDLFFAWSKRQPSYFFIDKSINYGAGFFIRKYKELGKGIYLFGQSRVGVNYNSDHFTNDAQPAYNYDNKGYNVIVGIFPGIAYTVSKLFQLEAGFNNLAYIEFDHSRQKPQSSNITSISNAFSLGSSVSNYGGFTVGFRILLN